MMKSLLFLFLIPFTIFSQPLQVNDTIRFLALGDSYTIGQSVGATERWPVQLSDSLASRGIVTDTMRIVATTGWRTDDLLNAINNQHLQNQHYNLVSLLIGVNNQYQGKPFSQYTTEFPALVDSAIRYAGGNKSRVFIVSIPDYAYTPFGQQSTNPGQISAELATYNQYNKRVADSLQIRYFDITPISQQGLQNTNYVASDGLHPSGLQYSKWVKLMLDVIDSEHTVTGISEHKFNTSQITLSPNPVTDNVHINFIGSSNEIGAVEIYNATGQLVLKETVFGTSAILPVSGLSEGLYTVKINNGKRYEKKKMVKLSSNR